MASGSIIGRWQYTATEQVPTANGQAMSVQEQGMAQFNPDGTYMQAVRFTNVPQFGQQIVEFMGRYQLNGNVLMTSPTAVQVVGGSNPQALCNMSTGACMPVPLQPSTQPLTFVDANTVQTAIGMAHRVP